MEIYEDILKDRRSEFSHLCWLSRKIDPVVAYKKKHKISPNKHKESVLKDVKIQELLTALSMEKSIPKTDLETEVQLILDEIGYNKNLRVIRLLGLFAIKICLKIYKGIYVKKDNLLKIKSLMGNCPVVFVPSHRSYADFILMSLICFTYDVEIPAVAAGMDFHGMFGMGSVLRDTGAFFMRRSYNNDFLYWVTFKQYINQIVTKGELPMEFFIEGTRSRSNKSLMPKFGLLNMILKPLFLRQVPDIIFVPINISYDKILEEKLFAFELLGVPKPKESTSGFFKSLGIIKEKYGAIHVTFGNPISSKDFFGRDLDRSDHSIGPVTHQELTDNDKKLIPPLAYKVIHCQQKLAVINVINMISLLLNNNLTNSKNLLTISKLRESLIWLTNILEKFGAKVDITDITVDIQDALTVHKNLIYVTGDGKIDVVRDPIKLTNLNDAKLKAFRMSERTMTYSVPFIMLYIYINPLLHYFVDAAIIVMIASVKTKLTKEDLFNQYCSLRNLLQHEFVTYAPNIPMEFEGILNHCLSLNLINCEFGTYNLWKNSDFQEILISTIQPFIYSYFNIVQTLEILTNCDEKSIFTEAQKKIVSEMDKKFIHPYSLNLDSISHCLSTLSSTGSLQKIRSSNGFIYVVNHASIKMIRSKLEPYTLKLYSGRTIKNGMLSPKL